MLQNDKQQYLLLYWHNISFVKMFTLLIVVSALFISQHLWLLLITPEKPGNKVVDSLLLLYQFRKMSPKKAFSSVKLQQNFHTEYLWTAPKTECLFAYNVNFNSLGKNALRKFIYRTLTEVRRESRTFLTKLQQLQLFPKSSNPCPLDHPLIN